MTALAASESPICFGGGWELHRAQRQLYQGGRKIKLGTRAYDVLQVLAEHPAQVVSRHDLLDKCWPGMVVEDGNLSVQMSTLRKLLGPDSIKTIPGVGYCFTMASEVSPPLPPPAPLPEIPPARQNNLTVHAPELIGRDDDIRRVAAMVRQHSVVTIFGPGGIGKTALARAVAHQLRDEFPGGVWLVELASILDNQLVVAAVAQTLGIWLPDKELELRRVVEAMPDAALLVLDNCEQVEAGVNAFVQGVVQHSRTKVLLTSQWQLSHQQDYWLEPLSLPVAGDVASIADHASVQLLETRVRQLGGQPRIADDHLEDAAQICRELDGLPLAIELAAAMVPLLGLSGVRERLGESLRLLTRSLQHVPARHETIHAALAWSHSLLSPEEQLAFRHLGVFAAPFTTARAEALLEKSGIPRHRAVMVLDLLVKKSLLMKVDGADPPRHRLLQSARQFAVERMEAQGEIHAVRHRHAEVMNALFQAALPTRWSEPSQVRLRRFLPELDEVRAALDWSLVRAPVLHASLVAHSAWLFGAAGQCLEGRNHCRDALKDRGLTLDLSVQAQLHHELGVLLHDDSSKQKVDMARAAVALFRRCGNEAGLFSALGRLTISASLCDDTETAAQAVQEMTRLWEDHEAQPVPWPPLAYWDLLNACDYEANLCGRLDEGKALAQAQKELAEEAGDTFRQMFAMMAEEQCTATDGHYAEAAALAQRLVDMARSERYTEKLHVYIANLATDLLMDGKLEAALVQAHEAFKLDKLNDSVWQSLDMLGMLSYARGRPNEAVIALGAAQKANDFREDFLEPVERNVRHKLIHCLNETFKDAALRAELERLGARMGSEKAAEYALGLRTYQPSSRLLPRPRR